MCIVGELQGGWSVAVAAGVSDMWQVTGDTWHVTPDTWLDFSQTGVLIDLAAAWFWSGSRLINQVAAWFQSGSCLINQAVAWLYYSGCLIHQAPLIMIRKLPDQSGSCLILIWWLPDRLDSRLIFIFFDFLWLYIFFLVFMLLSAHIERFSVSRLQDVYMVEVA